MITEKDRESLKKVIGNRYSRKVLQILNKNEAITSAGKSFSIEYIRQVFNGHHENKDVELAIYELRDKELILDKEIAQKKKSSTTPDPDENQ